MKLLHEGVATQQCDTQKQLWDLSHHTSSLLDKHIYLHISAIKGSIGTEADPRMDSARKGEIEVDDDRISERIVG